MTNHLKLLAIGLDGATFTVLDPLFAGGHLPHLERIFSQSATGLLRSTIPPVTALAWSTFLTGKNPGKHGMTGWQEPLNAQFDRPTTNARGIVGPKLWHYLNAAGHEVCLSNVPVTFPPEPINGVMVSGMLTPSLSADFTYPRDLKQELLEAFPDYKTDIDVRMTPRHRYRHGNMLQFLNEARSMTRVRGRSFRWLLDTFQPDVGVFVFELPDRLQHLLWKDVSQMTAGKVADRQVNEVRQHLLDCFRTLDDEVGKLLERRSESTHVLFLSDHGFGPIHTTVHINDWLAHHDWLHYDTLRKGGWQVLRQVGRRFKKWIPGKWVSRTKDSIPLYKTLNWRKTYAYSGSPSEYGIFLNCQDREPAGVVTAEGYESYRSQIMNALQEWRRPETGQAVVKAVYRREDVYKKPFVTRAPDILFELESGYYVSDLTSPSPGVYFSDISSEGWGFHEQDGIFAINGPGISQGTKLTEAAIADVLPTMLYALGLPIPNDMDGQLLQEAFLPSWLSDHPASYGELQGVEQLAAHRDAPIQEDASEAVKERLRNLGYLSD